MSEAIKREWRSVGLGGVSTVVSATKPPRNDHRIPPYAYDEANGHCIAYPFVEDDGKPRMDFVCFSHDDARLVAEAGNAWTTTGLTPRQLVEQSDALVERVKELEEALGEMFEFFQPNAWGSNDNRRDALDKARAALSKSLPNTVAEVK